MTDAYLAARQQMRDRRRRIIFNNDGCEARRDLATAAEFLDQRTTLLAGTHVDTISYCTCEGFGLFRHQTEIGRTTPAMGPDGRRNATVQALLAEGTDPLKEVTAFGHAHDMEVFWSMRMNWTKDGNKAEWFEVNRFKNENPDCLMGGRDESPRFRSKWAAVDYDHEKVRTTALAYIEEVCRNFDVDGIELDFFRQPILFRNTAEGRPVTDAQRGKMSDLMRRVTATLRREGERRGRPILLAVRTPDDPDYAATIGLDLECWMREGLLDLYIPSGYFRLRPWRDSIALGHRYGIKVYPGLSESRVGGRHHKHLWRASDECYRGRAANAWQAGADGIYTFNLFDGQRRVWRELGERAALRPLDKLYFASVRGVGPVPQRPGNDYPYADFSQIPGLTPVTPLALPPDGHRVTRIEMAEDLAAVSDTQKPTINLRLKTGIPVDVGVAQPDADTALDVVFNGHVTQQAEADQQWRRYPLDPTWVRTGYNTIEVINQEDCPALHLLDAVVTVDYSGAMLAHTSYHERAVRMI